MRRSLAKPLSVRPRKLWTLRLARRHAKPRKKRERRRSSSRRAARPPLRPNERLSLLSAERAGRRRSVGDTRSGRAFWARIGIPARNEPVRDDRLASSRPVGLVHPLESAAFHGAPGCKCWFARVSRTRVRVKMISMPRHAISKATGANVSEDGRVFCRALPARRLRRPERSAHRPPRLRQ